MSFSQQLRLEFVGCAALLLDLLLQALHQSLFFLDELLGLVLLGPGRMQLAGGIAELGFQRFALGKPFLCLLLRGCQLGLFLFDELFVGVFAGLQPGQSLVELLDGGLSGGQFVGQTGFVGIQRLQLFAALLQGLGFGCGVGRARLALGQYLLIFSGQGFLGVEQLAYLLVPTRYFRLQGQ